MTHEDFRKLYEAGKITVKVFEGEATITPYGAIENDVKELRIVEAFEYNGKYFLRIHIEACWTIYRNHGKVQGRLRRDHDEHFIKEFDTKAHANNYFKKVADGYNMKQV